MRESTNTIRQLVIQLVRLAAALFGIVALSMAIPVITALGTGEFDIAPHFLIPMAVCIIPAALVLLLTPKQRFTLSTRSVFILVAACWLVTGVIGAFPLYTTGSVPTFIDALYESISGFTTTGSTVINDVSALPVSINMWRCETHWLGGLGIVGLTVAITPLLGSNIFQLIKVETTGPDKGKVTPKIAETAKALWLIYLGLTLMLMVLLLIAGMNVPDAVAHALSTMGSGGFSTKTEGIGFYHSKMIEWACIVFMFLAATNFNLFYYAVTKRHREIAKNTEFRAYCALVAIAAVILALIILPGKETPLDALRHALFQVLAITTTTGFSSDNFGTWVPAAQMILFFLMFIGGCSGSTSGCIKVIRWVILGKQAKREYLRMLHPHGVFTIRINGRPIKGQVVFASAAFITLYLSVVIVATLITTAVDRTDLVTAFTASLSLLGNIGPGLARAGPAYALSFFSPPIKLMYCFVMIVGRLELYAILLFFFPSFWKKEA